MTAYTYTKEYCLLTKPGIIMGNLITTAGGFFLASKGLFHPLLFLITAAGLGLVIGSACAFNNYIDRELDKKMARTKKRALALGSISEKKALFFAAALGLSGSALLFFYTNPLTASIALFGFFVYVVLYSLSKYRTIHGTLIGSVAGAVPPVIGYTAVSGRLDLTALLLFLMVAMWQMPHFFSITLYRLEDYLKAELPVLPLKRGLRATKLQMLLYILAFTATTAALSFLSNTGALFLIAALLLSAGWLILCVQGFSCQNDKRWARKMFLYSLTVILTLNILIPINFI